MATLRSVDDHQLTEALTRMPADLHVIWNPIPLRILIKRAALSACQGPAGTSSVAGLAEIATTTLPKDIEAKP